MFAVAEDMQTGEIDRWTNVSLSANSDIRFRLEADNDVGGDAHIGVAAGGVVSMPVFCCWNGAGIRFKVASQPLSRGKRR